MNRRPVLGFSLYGRDPIRLLLGQSLDPKQIMQKISSNRTKGKPGTCRESIPLIPLIIRIKSGFAISATLHNLRGTALLIHGTFIMCILSQSAQMCSTFDFSKLSTSDT
jgi:hypothetical protein